LIWPCEDNWVKYLLFIPSNVECEPPPAARYNDHADPAHFQDPVPSQAQDHFADETIDVMKRRCAHQYESDDQRRAGQRNPSRGRCMARPDKKDHHRHHSHDRDQRDERQLDELALFIPPLVISEDAAGLRQCRLQIQLLVDAERQENN